MGEIVCNNVIVPGTYIKIPRFKLDMTINNRELLDTDSSYYTFSDNIRKGNADNYTTPYIIGIQPDFIKAFYDKTQSVVAGSNLYYRKSRKLIYGYMTGEGGRGAAGGTQGVMKIFGAGGGAAGSIMFLLNGPSNMTITFSTSGKAKNGYVYVGDTLAFTMTANGGEDASGTGTSSSYGQGGTAQIKVEGGSTYTSTSGQQRNLITNFNNEIYLVALYCGGNNGERDTISTYPTITVSFDINILSALALNTQTIITWTKGYLGTGGLSAIPNSGTSGKGGSGGYGSGNSGGSGGSSGYWKDEIDYSV